MDAAQQRLLRTARFKDGPRPVAQSFEQLQQVVLAVGRSLPFAALPGLKRDLRGERQQYRLGQLLTREKEDVFPRRYAARSQLPRDLSQRPRVPDHRIRIPSASLRSSFRQEPAPPLLRTPFGPNIRLHKRFQPRSTAQPLCATAAARIPRESTPLHTRSLQGLDCIYPSTPASMQSPNAPELPPARFPSDSHSPPIPPT